MEIKIKNITKTKVVSRSFITDIIASLQNIIGANLTGYEKMINTAIKQIQEDLIAENIKLSWYRYEITQLTNGAVAVMIYGDIK